MHSLTNAERKERLCRKLYESLQCSLTHTLRMLPVRRFCSSCIAGHRLYLNGVDIGHFGFKDLCAIVRSFAVSR